MDPQMANPGSKLRPIFDAMTRSFGSVLVLLVLAYWLSEAYGTGRWRALPLVAMVYTSIVIALRIVKPSRVRRHLAIMGAALVLGAIAAAMDKMNSKCPPPWGARSSRAMPGTSSRAPPSRPCSNPHRRRIGYHDPILNREA